jgi:hypothetical protein
MTTAKKILTLALCLTCLTAGMTGCAKDKSSSVLKAHHHNQKAATARR